MTKVSVVLYYWILIAAALLFTKAAGLMENDMAVIKIVVVVTILYAGVILMSYSKGRAQTGNQEQGNRKRNPDSSGKKGKKKK